MAKNRIDSLDYLRGIAAFGIMIYHYWSWSFGRLDASSFLGRFGVYGVSIFYILSGITLYHVYHQKLDFTAPLLSKFFKKRIFRIFPLLWLVTAIALYLKEELPPLSDLLLNISGLFGFFSWETYFSPGIWSIGNELVFYSMFPLFLLASKKGKFTLLAISAIIMAVFIYFTFKVLPNSLPEEQWRNYINPLNQVIYFFGGFLMAHFFKTKNFNQNKLLIILFLSVITFVLLPVTGEQFFIKTGWTRIAFTLSSFALCFSVFKFPFQLNNTLHKPLKTLGEISYSVYLIHPIVHDLSLRFHKNISSLPTDFQWIYNSIITLIVSYFVFQYFEKTFIKLAHQSK